MPSKISSLRYPIVSAAHRTETVRYLETFIPYFKQNIVNVFIVQPIDVARFPGDLYGYLQFKSVSPDHHYVIMRVNDWVNPNQFDASVTQVLIPNLDLINRQITRMRATLT